eukprot:1600865-Rhodomonas_salina.3
MGSGARCARLSAHPSMMPKEAQTGKPVRALHREGVRERDSPGRLVRHRTSQEGPFRRWEYCDSDLLVLLHLAQLYPSTSELKGIFALQTVESVPVTGGLGRGLPQKFQVAIIRAASESIQMVPQPAVAVALHWQT